MKRYFTYYIYISLMCLSCLFSSCKFDYSDPDESNDVYMSDVEATGTTTTIGALKEQYKDIINDDANRHRWTYVEDDVIFDGYVCGNDISGNLFQALYVRKGDDAIVVGIADNSLWTTYPVGTHIVVNLKGLYIGSYGNLAKIGAPYTTSGSNRRLGGMAKFKALTSISVIGFNKDAYECQPIEINSSWLQSKSGNTKEMMKWSPMLVQVRNAVIQPYNNRKVYAAYVDRDAGNGVNNTILIDGDKYTMRQSTLSDFASDLVPTCNVDVTAILTRYGSDWQLALRSLDDVIPLEDVSIEE